MKTARPTFFSRIRFRLALASLAAASAAAAAPALSQLADEADPQKLWALVVGISSYTHAEPLLFASSDAQSVADFLKSPRGGGIPEDHLFTLLESQASRYELLVQIEALQETVGDGDTIYIYIAGHGFINRRGIGYFIPSDGDLKVPAATAVPFSSIKELIDLGLAHARNRILITDICHSGRIGPEKTRLAEKIQNLINAEFMKLGSTPGGTFLNLLASQPSEPSWESDELGHGVFTYALLEALNGRSQAGEEKLVDAQEVVQFVREEVPKWTGNQQNPMANENFNPSLTLSYLDRPGPEIFVRQDDTILLLEHGDETPYIRAQWVDPRNESIAVRQIPKDKPSVPIASLAPGALELSLFDSQNNQKTLTVNLEKGENRLDIRSTLGGRLRFQPGTLKQVASLSAPAPPAPAFQTRGPALAAAPESTLLLQAPRETQVFVDGNFFGNGQGAGSLLAIQGLPTGPRFVRLVHSPEHEQRFRLKLFAGPQILDPASGELQPVPAVEAPPESAPPGLPPQQEDLYRRFERALWEGRLIAPSGNSAWDFFLQLEGSLAPALRDTARRRLVVAMGDRAQQTVLKYLRGGDIRWNAEVFEEGAELIDRIERIFQRSDFYESQRRFFLGRSLIERGEFERALRELAQASALDPEASHAYNAQGLAHWRRDELNQALPPLERAIELTPRWTYPRLTRSLILLEQRRYAEAEQGLQEALSLDPEDSAVQHALGQVYFLQGRWGEAERQVRRAIELNPGNAYAYQTLGFFQQRLQRFQEAEESYRLAIRLEPEEPAFRLSLADMLRQLGRVGEARTTFAALAQDPGSPETLQAYAQFLASQNQAQEAERVFAQAIGLAPRKANLRVNHGIFLREAGKTEEAVREFKKALELDSSNAFARYQLAEIHFSEKKLSEAQKEAAQAVQSDPLYAPPHRLLGQLAFARREHDEALSHFRRARELSIEPHQRQALQETIDQIEAVIVDEQLEAAEKKVGRGDFAGAWKTYGDTLARAPDSRNLRNRILEFLAARPEAADPASLPASPWSGALRTSFWRRQAEAEKLWSAGLREEAATLFSTALRELQGNDLRLLSATAFNFGNEENGIHALAYRWAIRWIEEGHFQQALDLMRTCQEKMIFAPVPNYSPLTIDSLMAPEDVLDPRVFEDFEVAHHPDRRAHEVLAAASAGLGDMETARRYLEALDARGVDLPARCRMAEALRLQQRWEEAVSLLSAALAQIEPEARPAGLAETYATLASIQCQSGDCEAAKSTLRSGLRRLPDSPLLRKALQDLR